MATKAKHSERVEFHDGTEMWLRPLTIKNLRVFMEMLDKIRKDMTQETEEAAEEIDELGMLGQFIELAMFSVNAQRKDDEQYTADEFEDLVDMPTVQDIMRIAGGVEVGNPTATTQTPSLAGRR